jgi:hypothetical protein
VPGIQACTSPAGRRTRSGSVQVLDAATAYLMPRPCPMPEASAQRAIVVAPSSPHAPLVSGPSPDPFAPTLERGWRSSAGRKRRALYTQDQVRRQLSAKPCQILPKGSSRLWPRPTARYRVIGCAAGPVGDLLDVVDRSRQVRPEGTVPADHLGLQQADCRFGQGVIVASPPLPIDAARPSKWRVSANAMANGRPAGPV